MSMYLKCVKHQKVRHLYLLCKNNAAVFSKINVISIFVLQCINNLIKYHTADTTCVSAHSKVKSRKFEVLGTRVFISNYQ